MTYFFESDDDLANTGGGVLPEGTNSPWYADVTHTSGMDIADYIELTYDRKEKDTDEDEYRDERDESSRLADRHGC